MLSQKATYPVSFHQHQYSENYANNSGSNGDHSRLNSIESANNVSEIRSLVNSQSEFMSAPRPESREFDVFLPSLSDKSEQGQWNKMTLGHRRNLSMASLTRLLQTSGQLPDSDELLTTPKPDYFTRWLVGGKDVAIDKRNNDVDLCYLPNRRGTRSGNDDCFLCSWEKDRIYWKRPGDDIFFTHNMKPYTDQAHYLLAPVGHQSQEFSEKSFLASLSEVNEAAARKVEQGLTPTRTCLFAGPVGGSQPHQHWHLLDKTTRLEKALDRSIDLKPLALLGDSGIFHLNSKPLQTQFLDGPSKSISFYDCILVRGNEDFVNQWTTKVIDHLSEKGEGNSPRALYNLAILPPDSQQRSRVVIFPRSPDPEKADVTHEVIWGDKRFSPSAHELAGHWFIKDFPENPDPSSLDESQFHELLTEIIYDATASVRVPVEALELDKVMNGLVQFHDSPSTFIRNDQGKPNHLAVEWYGWGDLDTTQPAVPREKPLLTSYSASPKAVGTDLDHISPLLNQSQINDVYEMLSKVHELFLEHDVSYFVGAGTLMGAIRHGGHMWNDDDADVYVRQEDKTKIESMKEKFAERGLTFHQGALDNSFQVSKIGAPKRNDGVGLPFVDICLMAPEIQDGQLVRRFIDSPQARGETHGPTFIHQVPEHTFSRDQQTTIAFGKNKDKFGFQGIPVQVPKEHDAIQYLNKVYGNDWFDLLKTTVHDHMNNQFTSSVALSIACRGHVSPLLNKSE